MSPDLWTDSRSSPGMGARGKGVDNSVRCGQPVPLLRAAWMRFDGAFRLVQGLATNSALRKASSTLSLVTLNATFGPATEVPNEGSGSAPRGRALLQHMSGSRDRVPRTAWDRGRKDRPALGAARTDGRHGR